MKKLLSLCFALLIGLNLVACQPASSDTAQTTVVTTTTSASITTTATADTSTTVAPTTSTVASTTKSATTITVAPTTTTTLSTTTTATATTTTAVQTTTTAKRVSTITPALYAVTKASTGATIWLFGSIHIGSEEMYPLPDYVLNAFNKADYLAVECDITDISEAESTAALEHFVYEDRSTIDEHIPARLYADARDILEEKGAYSVYLNYYMPALWSDLIDSYHEPAPDAHPDFGVDLHLIDLAKKKQKKVLEIESVASQYGIMANFSPALQEQLLEESVLAYYSPDDSSSKGLLELWKKGDVATLREQLSSASEDNPPEMQPLIDEYQKAMYTNRDQKIFDYALNRLLERTSVFICVGTAHIVGENGLLDRFEALDGFNITVTRITK